MKRTGNPQINTKLYWNHVYSTPAKALEYWAATDRFFKLIEYVEDGDKFIDIGCGVGFPGKLLKRNKKDCEVWGVDISDKIIEENKERDSDIKYYQGYIGNLDFLPRDYFDVVFCGETIEHIDHPSDLFNEAYVILKDKGKLIVTTPIEDRVGSPEHIWSFTKEDIDKLYKDAGFKKVEYEKLRDMEHLYIFFAVGEK